MDGDLNYSWTIALCLLVFHARPDLTHRAVHNAAFTTPHSIHLEPFASMPTPQLDGPRSILPQATPDANGDGITDDPLCQHHLTNKSVVAFLLSIRTTMGLVVVPI